jgi:hypothetical protein
MRTAKLTEPDGKSHNLTSLVQKGKGKITIGIASKDSTQLIQIGKNADSPVKRTISREHAVLYYSSLEDRFAFNNVSQEGSTINNKIYPTGGKALDDGDILEIMDQ